MVVICNQYCVVCFACLFLLRCISSLSFLILTKYFYNTHDMYLNMIIIFWFCIAYKIIINLLNNPSKI
jgi:hypothetical protein